MNKKNITIAFIALFVAILLVDRWYWAQISQWREDQATNIWLGYTTELNNMPVGLMSSKGIPNPNGMIILGFLLSALPNLLSVSFFLGVSQMFLFVMIGFKAFDKSPKYFLLAVIPPLSSVILSSISVEFWNQYIITLINIFYIYWAVSYLRDRSLWNLPPILALILLAPSLYLAGIVNALVMVILTIGIFLYKLPTHVKGIPYILIICLTLFIFSLLITWIPYYHNVGLEKIAGYNKSELGPVAMLQTAWEALFNFPVYATFQWADMDTLSTAFKHADPNVISHTANILLRVISRVYLAQAIFAFLTLLYFIIINFFKNEFSVNISVVRVVIISGIFIVLSYTFSTFLGGPEWINGQRPDQAVQFLPMFLLVIFLLPHLITANNQVNKIINWFSYLNLFFFCVTNLLCGPLIIRDHLQYHGNVLSEADVPLADKIQVFDFIAKDWESYSASEIIPVDYDLGGGRWDWVPEFGSALTQWYPAPMTQGRSFDYELLRKYGLSNQQEGIQIRTFGRSRYLVTYAFEDPPVPLNGEIIHYIFGRLRVSIIENTVSP